MLTKLQVFDKQISDKEELEKMKTTLQKHSEKIQTLEKMKLAGNFEESMKALDSKFI